MIEPIEKLDELVHQLNSKFHNHFLKAGVFPETCVLFQFTSNGTDQAILFLEQVIWCSDCDERDRMPKINPNDLEEDDGDYELVEFFVRRRAMAFIKTLSTLELW